jgi:rare lipoprotein A
MGLLAGRTVRVYNTEKFAGDAKAKVQKHELPPCPHLKRLAASLTASCTGCARLRRSRSSPPPAGRRPQLLNGLPRVSRALQKTLHQNQPRKNSRFAGVCALVLLLAVLAAGCGGARPVTARVSPVPGAYLEQGVASWYGIPFNGRRAADGEIFDMNQPVAAHRTLPFGSMVRVTNLTNGKQTEVRIIDRGPFVNGRIIDLSFGAARSIDMVGEGIARVRLELISSAAPLLAGNFTVQVGAFTQRQNAERLRERLLKRYTPIFIQESDTSGGHFFRVKVGRVATEQEAQQLATKLTSQERFQTFVVRLDETP